VRERDGGEKVRERLSTRGIGESGVEREGEGEC
jgi:hypothetical protein